MTTYTAWDGQEYPAPPPEGWYLAVDQRWWPQGHGPGPAGDASSAADHDQTVPPALRAPTRNSGDVTSSASVDEEEPSTTEPSIDDVLPGLPKRTRSASGLKTVLLVGAGLSVVVAAALLVITAASDDDSAPPTSTAPSTTLDIDDTPATTADPDAETTTTVPGKGSATDPYAIGEPIRLVYDDITAGEERVWEVEVTGPPVDRTSEVLEGNQFNEPPPEGRRYVIAPIKVTYVSGPAPASLFDLNFKVVGPSAVVFTTFDPSCGAVPDALDTLAELFPGGVVEGNLCWVTPTDDIDDLTMLVEVFLVDGDTYVDLSAE